MAISKIDSKALTDSSVVDADIADGTITSAKLAGSVANAKLQNSTVTINGTSVSLGASGSIPAVSWQSVKTNSDSPVTLVAGNGYFMDTTSGAITATLPGSPSAGDTIAIKDYAGTFATNNLTIGRNGNNIQGVANDSLISTNRASLTLVYVDATKGWLYAVESNVADLEGPIFITATGGTISTSGDFKVHTFTGDGCFVVSNIGGCRPIDGPSNVDYLVVAGGAGAGAGSSGSNIGAGAGGGAGGFREGRVLPAPESYTASPLVAPAGLPVSAQTYPITVGGGGTAGGNNPGGSGSNSTFSTITSAGGGGGGGNDVDSGVAGGSGGGKSINPGTAGAGNTPPVAPPQGNTGGATAPVSPNTGSGSGGGGAGAVGGNGTPNGSGGPGGAGVTTSISGSSTAYAGGGGGRGFNGTGGTGGSGGGGAGSQFTSTPGTINTGGGGGAGAFGVTGTGGSGIVIIRYKFQ